MHQRASSRPGFHGEQVDPRANESISEKNHKPTALLRLGWQGMPGPGHRLLPRGLTCPPGQGAAPEVPCIVRKDFKRPSLRSLMLLGSPPRPPTEAGLQRRQVWLHSLPRAPCRNLQVHPCSSCTRGWDAYTGPAKGVGTHSDPPLGLRASLQGMVALRLPPSCLSGAL